MTQLHRAVLSQCSRLTAKGEKYIKMTANNMNPAQRKCKASCIFCNNKMAPETDRFTLLMTGCIQILMKKAVNIIRSFQLHTSTRRSNIRKFPSLHYNNFYHHAIFLIKNKLAPVAFDRASYSLNQ
jgi:hypothetical protein